MTTEKSDVLQGTLDLLILHVAALASTARRSHYSNYGNGIDLSAPSSNSHAYGRLPVTGRGITTAQGPNLVRDDFGGTSSATPLVAGVAALALSANPRLSALELASLLKETASKDLSMAGYARTQAAFYDPQPVWDVSPVAPHAQGDFLNQGLPEGTWSPWFGHGKVDAEAAVRRARELAGGARQTIRHASGQPIDIPDNDPTGISSRITVPESGAVLALRISVDVAHTYRGDLVVRLVAPDGRGVDLHRRAGGRIDDVIEAYDASSRPDLEAFSGMEVRGSWALQVSDNARIDEGTLRSWTLEADILGDGAVRAESSPGTRIPDNDPAGIIDTINVIDARTVEEIKIEVDVTHPWIGDLRIELTGPDDTTALVRERTGGRADDIDRTYRRSDTPELSRFIGKQAAGAWKLRVADLAGRDVGKLNRWGLVIH